MTSSMRTLGLLGGMSWQSTLHYYRLINTHTTSVLTPSHSCPLLLSSLDFSLLLPLLQRNDFASASTLLLAAAHGLKAAGAEAIVICANTMHISSSRIPLETGLPLLHIGDATASAPLALLGTRPTMTLPFLKSRLRSFGLTVIVPDEDDQELVHNIIFDELAQGVVRRESQVVYQQVVERLKARGAEAVVLGCTEIMMLVEGVELALPGLDTTAIHARAVAEWALGREILVGPGQAGGVER